MPLDGRDPNAAYSLVELLGEGSYGCVYKAVSTQDASEVAVKIVPCASASEVESMSGEIDFLRRMSSTYVVAFVDNFLFDQELWIVMEYCGGGSMSDLLELCQGSLAELYTKAVVAYVALGLDYLHSQANIHRDIKAGNILLTRDGKAKLADFGVSVQLTNTVQKRKTITGTPYWIAPEVVQEVSYDYKADIWSLGVTILELSEGHPPYFDVHPMRAIFMISMKPAPSLSEPTRWSSEMRDFCSKCLVRSPTERAAAQDLLTHPWIAEEVELARGDVGSFALKALVDQHWEGISSSRVVRRKSVAIGSADKAQPQLDNHALRNKVSLMKVSQAISAKERPAYVFENTDGDTDGITLNFNYEDTFKATTGQRRRSSMLSQDSQGTDEGTLPFGVRKGSIFADAITETYRLNAEDITGINITEIAMVEAIPDFRDKNVYTGVNPGDLYGRTKVLGRGSYGVVYQGRNLVSGEEIAIKVLPCPHPSDVGQEIEILRRLDNPFIVNFYQAFLGNKELWIVMEFCGGGSLADVLKHMKITLNEEQVVGITASCVMGLTYLHGLLGIHRDIKAGNILLSGDGEAKLADFGVSAQLKHTLQQRNTLIGTPFWMAPEVIQENDYDYKADIWSLGITILELCEGHPPHFDLHPMRAVFLIPMAKAPTLKEPDKWSSSMVQFLAKCLEKDPNDRASILDLSTHNWIHASVIAIQQKGKLEVLKELAEAAVANVEGRGDAALEEET